MFAPWTFNSHLFLWPPYHLSSSYAPARVNKELLQIIYFIIIHEFSNLFL